MLRVLLCKWRFCSASPITIPTVCLPAYSFLSGAGVKVRQNVVKLIRDIIFIDLSEAEGDAGPDSPQQQRVMRASVKLLQTANKPTEDEKTKDMIKELFEELWFKPSVRRSKPKPPALSFLTAPADLMSPLPTADGGDGEGDGDAAATPYTVVEPSTPHTPISPTRVYRSTSAQQATPTPTAANILADTEAGWRGKAQQVVALVDLESSTAWLAAMVRRFIFGSDASADPRAKVRWGSFYCK